MSLHLSQRDDHERSGSSYGLPGRTTGNWHLFSRHEGGSSAVQDHSPNVMPLVADCSLDGTLQRTGGSHDRPLYRGECTSQPWTGPTRGEDPRLGCNHN